MYILQKIKFWFPYVLLTICVCFTFYVISQQMLRLGANDLPNQISVNIANKLSDNLTIQQDLPSKIDLTNNQSPFVIVYDGTGKQIISTASINGTSVEIPQGVLNEAKVKGQNRVTWQPQQGIREAIVVTYYTGGSTGYVVAGKSLQETENLEDKVLSLAGLGFLGTIGVTFIGSEIFFFLTGRIKLNKLK